MTNRPITFPAPEVRATVDERCLCIRCCAERRLPEEWRGSDLSNFRYACEVCGNKRCPHHSDHRNKCTGSNEPDQLGSVYA